MAGNGIWKIYGGGFVRTKPRFCPNCAHYREPDKEGWERCAVNGKRLSNPHTVNAKCAEYAPGVERPALMAAMIQSASEHQEWKKRCT